MIVGGIVVKILSLVVPIAAHLSGVLSHGPLDRFEVNVYVGGEVRDNLSESLRDASVRLMVGLFFVRMRRRLFKRGG